MVTTARYRPRVAGAYATAEQRAKWREQSASVLAGLETTRADLLANPAVPEDVKAHLRAHVYDPDPAPVQPSLFAAGD